MLENEYQSEEITFDSNASEETPQSQELSGVSSAPEAQAANAATPADGQLPDKYKGKSLADVIEMHRQAESKLGEMGSDVARWKRTSDELSERIRQLELAGRQQAQPDEDPVELLKREVEKDPLQAIVNYVNRSTGKVAQKVDGVYSSVQQEKAREYVQTQLRDNPDFKENWPTMLEFEKQYVQMVKPEYLGHPQLVQLLYTLARGHNVARYEQRAAEKVTAAKSQVRSEKKAAFSESSSSSRGALESSDFDKLSLEEMEARLPKADYYR